MEQDIKALKGEKIAQVLLVIVVKLDLETLTVSPKSIHYQTPHCLSLATEAGLEPGFTHSINIHEVHARY